MVRNTAAQWLETLTMPALSPVAWGRPDLWPHLPPFHSQLGRQNGPGSDALRTQGPSLTVRQEVAVAITQAEMLTWDLMARPCGSREKG